MFKVFFYVKRNDEMLSAQNEIVGRHNWYSCVVKIHASYDQNFLLPNSRDEGGVVVIVGHGCGND